MANLGQQQNYYKQRYAVSFLERKKKYAQTCCHHDEDPQPPESFHF